MLYPRLLLSKARSESGSAVSDFVLLVVPGSLLCLPLIDLFGIYQSAIVSKQVSYEIARYASLADVSQSEAIAYGKLRDSRSSLSMDTSALSCSSLVVSEVQRRVTFWPEVVSIPIQARAECEN
ncbi:MAG: hypothetical protein RLZZ606_993 [Actinomycetota bacterium]|jgi:hypothetical protein